MTQLEIHTNQGLVGRSMPSGSKLIESVFSRVKGENPFHIERIWDLIGKALGLPLFPVKDGYITVPDKPGLGIDPNPEAVERYRVG